MIYQLHTVSVHYDNKIPALHSIDMEINAGTVTLLSGPTGAGKTTLLRLLWGDISPTLGSVIFKRQDISRLSPVKRKLLKQITGIIFQGPRLLKTMTCYENVMVPMILNKNSRQKSNRRCLEILTEMGISYLRTKYPDELSLGEKKLVSTARALVHEPEIIIADEPSDNLDRDSKMMILEMFRENVERGATLVMSTNDKVTQDFFAGARKIYLKEGKSVAKY